MHAGLTSVVIVTADSGADAGECVAGVLAGSAPVEVIVVDNDSRDGSIAQLEACFAQRSEVRIVYNDKNLGFGAACNRGATLARGDALLFLNPDCRIGSDTIAQLRRVLQTDAQLGVIGAAQVDAQGRIDAASRRRDPLLARALASASGLARFAMRWPALAGVELPPCEALPAVEKVDAISGALMLLPRAAFDRVNGFDEGYFLHCEDLDLCRRVRDAGWSVACVNAVRVEHGKGGSSRHRALFVAWHKHRGMWRWFVKFDPAARHVVVRAWVWCVIWAGFVLSVPLRLLPRRRVARTP